MIPPYLSELRIFSFSIVPAGWLPCDGRLLPISQNLALFALLGNVYGGDGKTTFAIPDLQGRVPMGVGLNMPRGKSGGEDTHTLTVDEIPSHNHNAIASSTIADSTTPQNNFWSGNNSLNAYGPSKQVQMSGAALGMAGSSIPHDNMMPFVTTNICIAVVGIFPGEPRENYDGSWCGEIRMFAGNVVPKQYSTCDGQKISVSDNTPLFSVLGSYYTDGPAIVYFYLPNLAGRAAVKNLVNFSDDEFEYPLGSMKGVTEVILTGNQTPEHTHAPMAIAEGTSKEPVGLTWANVGGRNPPNTFSTQLGAGQLMNTGCINSNGGGGAHNNLMPYTVVVFCISLNGLFPGRNE